MSPANGRARAGLGRTIPAMPMRDVRAAVAHYRDRFGFDAVHETDDFAVLMRDEAVLHLRRKCSGSCVVPGLRGDLHPRRVDVGP